MGEPPGGPAATRGGQRRAAPATAHGASAQHSAADFAYTALPSYAPELSRGEQCDQWVKQDMLHALPASIDELLATVRGRCRRLQHHPDRLANFFAHAGLRVD